MITQEQHCRHSTVACLTRDRVTCCREPGICYPCIFIPLGHEVFVKYKKVYVVYVTCGNTGDTGNGCQLISHSQAGKDFKRKEILNLNLEQNTLVTAASPKI